MCSMRDFGHTAGGDEAELLLWLHDARRAQPLSERFRVRIARDGFSNYVDRLHANSTLFAVSIELIIHYLVSGYKAGEDKFQPVS